METRRRNKRVQVQSSDVAVGTGVYAPSQVATQSKSARSAAALGDFLGLAGNVAQTEIKRQQGLDSAEGARSAMRGEFTDEELHTMKKSAAFVQGAQKVLAKQRIIEDAAAAKEWYQTEFDKGAGLDELRHGLNEFWKERYEGVSTGIAREIAPLMAESSDQIMKAHADFQTEAMHNQLIGAQGEVLDAALKAGNYDWSALRQEGNAVIGKDAMNAVAVNSIARHALASLDETVWDRPEFEMLRKNTKYSDAIQQSIVDTRTARHKANENATINNQGRVLAEIGVSADAGRADFPALMAKASVADPKSGIALVETDTQATALWARWYKARTAPAEDSMNATLWRQGRGRHIAKTADRDKAAMDDATDRAQELADQGDIPEESIGEVARAYLIERSVVNRWLPQQLKEEIEVSPQNPEAFKLAVEMYDSFEAERPDWVATELDPNVVRDIRAYKRHLAQTGSEEEAISRTNTSDPALYKAVNEKTRFAAEDKIVETLKDGPLWFDSGIADNDRLRSMVREDFQYYVEAGLPPELAVEETVKNLKNRYSVVDGQLYRQGEWTNPAGADKAVEVAKQALAAENNMLTLFGRNPDIDEISVLPVPNRPGYVYMAIAGPLQSYGSMTPVAIADIEDGYQAYLQAAAATAEDRQDVESERKARESLLPIPNSAAYENPDLYQQMLEERDSRWNALSPEQRDVLKSRQRN